MCCVGMLCLFLRMVLFVRQQTVKITAWLKGSKKLTRETFALFAPNSGKRNIGKR